MIGQNDAMVNGWTGKGGGGGGVTDKTRGRGGQCNSRKDCIKMTVEMLADTSWDVRVFGLESQSGIGSVNESCTVLGTDRPSREPCAVRCTAKNYSRERPTDRPGRAQRGKKSTVGTDRPTDLAARSAAKIRVGPTDRPTRPRAARRKIDGRDRPTDRPCRAQRGEKFTVGTDRPTDPKQLSRHTDS